MANDELDATSGVPLYRQIEDILRTEIVNNAADPDTPMTEALLLDRFKVSRAPIRQALRELTTNGYVYRKQGKGTFPVTGARVMRPKNVRVGHLQQFLTARGMHPVSVVSPVARETPPEEIRDRLALNARERLLHFNRIICVKGDIPILDADVFIRCPTDFNPTVQELEATGSAFELLERRYGIILERAEHDTWATGATPEHAQALGIAEGSPLLAMETVFYTTGGVPAGWRMAVHRADDFTYHFVESR